MKTKSIVPYLFIALVGVAFMKAAASPVFAQNCTTQYGGTTTCTPTDLTVNKMVAQPNTNPTVYLENLDQSMSYAPGAQVVFKLTIKNASGQTFNPVNVKDILPPYFTYVSGGPSGTSYDPNTKTITFGIPNMIAGSSQDVYITAKIDGTATTGCVLNTAQVSATERPNPAQDTARVCIAGNAQGTLPKAGFEDILYALPFVGTGLAGLALLRKRG